MLYECRAENYTNFSTYAISKLSAVCHLGDVVNVMLFTTNIYIWFDRVSTLSGENACLLYLTLLHFASVRWNYITYLAIGMK